MTRFRPPDPDDTNRVILQQFQTSRVGHDETAEQYILVALDLSIDTGVPDARQRRVMTITLNVSTASELAVELRRLLPDT